MRAVRSLLTILLFVGLAPAVRLAAAGAAGEAAPVRLGSAHAAGVRSPSVTPTAAPHTYLPLIARPYPQIRVDGAPGDWQGIAPIGYGGRGDSFASTPGGDLIRFYAFAAPEATYFLWEMNGPITDTSLGFQLLIDKDSDGIGWSADDLVLQPQPGACPSALTPSGWSCAFGDRFLEMAVGAQLLPAFQRLRVLPLVTDPQAGTTLNQLSCHPDVYLPGTLPRTPAETLDLETRAGQVHLNGWQALVEAAQTEPASRYAFYSSRVLAVKHPEVYLLADLAFLNDIRSHPYRPYVLTGAAVAANPMIRQQEFFPAGYPFLPYLDRRTMGPVSTLKNGRGFILGIDRAMLTYALQRSSLAAEDLYIVYTDDDHSYLATPDGLLDVSRGAYVAAPQGNPVLIFNEDAVWYPLLERDDRAAVPALAAAVARYAGAVVAPALAPEETALIGSLRQITALDNRAQVAVAVLAASKGFGLPSVRALIYAANAGQALEWGQDTLIIARDTRISPLAAYLAAVGQLHEDTRRWFDLSAEMAGLINVRCRPEEDDPTGEFSDGFFDPWDFEHPAEGVPMARVNLNDMYYSRAGGDDGRVHAVAEIVEMLGADPLIYYDARTRLSRQIPAGGPPHLILPAANLKFESSDLAASLLFNGVLNGAGSSVAERAMEFYQHEGRFAAIIIGQYQGTMSPTEAGQIASDLHSLYADDRYFVKWDGVMWQPINYEEFILAVPAEQARWSPPLPLP